MAVPVLGDCNFEAEVNDNGQFVGRCQQFPGLHSKPRKNRLDAIDDIITAVSNKIRRLDAAAVDLKGPLP